MKHLFCISTLKFPQTIIFSYVEYKSKLSIIAAMCLPIFPFSELQEHLISHNFLFRFISIYSPSDGLLRTTILYEHPHENIALSLHHVFCDQVWCEDQNQDQLESFNHLLFLRSFVNQCYP